MITWMEKANNFQIAEFQAQGLVWILLYFRQFQPGVAYKKACSVWWLTDLCQKCVLY